MLISGACGSEFEAVFLLWGGNCNNALLCGAAFNVNNAFSNANWNIGPSPTYRKSWGCQSNAPACPTPQDVATRLPAKGIEGKLSRPRKRGDKGMGQ